VCDRVLNDESVYALRVRQYDAKANRPCPYTGQGSCPVMRR